MRNTLLMLVPFALACRGGPEVESGEVLSSGLSTPPCELAPPDLDGDAQDALGGEGVPFDADPEGWDSGGWDSGGWDSGGPDDRDEDPNDDEPAEDDPGQGPGTGSGGQGDGGPPGGGPA